MVSHGKSIILLKSKKYIHCEFNIRFYKVCFYNLNLSVLIYIFVIALSGYISLKKLREMRAICKTNDCNKV